MKKEMSPKAFWLLLTGLVINIAYGIVNVVIALTTDIDEQLSAYSDVLDQSMIDAVKNMVLGTLIVIYVIFFAANGFFLFRVLLNKKKPTKQVYLTVLFVLSIIGLVINLIALFSSFLALINLAIYVVLIVGRVMQKNHSPAEEVIEHEDVFKHEDSGTI